MSDRLSLSGPILSCPTGANRPTRRFAALAGALLLHLLILMAPLLVPLFIIEMMQAPEATDHLIFVLPPRTPSVGPLSKKPRRVRKGGGQSTPSRTTAPPRIVPFDQPAPNPEPIDVNTLEVEDGMPGLPAGPGLPDGDGDDIYGTQDGCPGCGEGGPLQLGPDPRENRVYDWDPNVIAPVLIPSTRQLPKYPRIARLAGVDGSIVLLAAIRPDGTVGEIEVLRAPEPRFGFEFAAIEAVKQWRYQPGLMHGRPVTVYIRVIIEFTLSR